MRFARPLPIIALAAALAAGCGSSSSEQSGNEQSQAATTQPPTARTAPTAPAGASAQSCSAGVAGVGELRVAGVACKTGRLVTAGWSGDASCASPAAASRFGCTVRGYRCLGAATERGIAVSCARPNRSISFIAKRG
ncbi:MAG: hypothetical protein FVQ78_05040 [Solirubrobacterales bacterium]|nr:hypothetical protein [Solirubrobacterales bacterium]